MADNELVSSPVQAPASSPVLASPLSASSNEDTRPVGSMIAELDASQSELLTKLQSLKLDVQNWRSKLDTQVKTYKDELSQLKEALNTELEQLTSDFQELRTTLKKQQEDVSTSLRSLGLGDRPEPSEEPENQHDVDNMEKAQFPSDSTKETESSDASVAESSL